VRLKQFQPAHQHIEQLFARGLLRHVGIDPGKYGLVDVLDMCGENRKRGSELSAQIRQRNAGALGKLGKSNSFERLFGQQREKRRDDFVPAGVAARR